MTVNFTKPPATSTLFLIFQADPDNPQVQSADAGGNESVNQTATPSNTPGIVGDKPIETIGEIGKTALTGGTSTVLKQAASAAGLTGTNTNVEKAATAATGSAVRWLFLTGAAINALSVAWSSLSSQLDWPSSSGLSSSSVYLDTADCCLVTDYDFGDGAIS